MTESEEMWKNAIELLRRFAATRNDRSSMNTDVFQNYATRLNIQLDSIPYIHIAGSKGKGSTAAFSDTILRNQGIRTGLFTSPHLLDIRERIRIDGELIPKEHFAQSFWKIYNGLHIAHGGPVPTFFQYLTLMAFDAFIEAKVDVAIMEVGIGGRLDPTNIIPAPVVCCVTSLGLEHTAILGDTIEKIAFEKAGIFKPSSVAVTAWQKPEAFEIVQRQATKAGIPLILAPPLTERVSHGVPHLGLAGEHQIENASIAATMCQLFLDRNNPVVQQSLQDLQKLQSSYFSRARLESSEQFFTEEQAEEKHALPQFGQTLYEQQQPLLQSLGLLSSKIVEGLSETEWAGRCQTIHHSSGMTFYLDGAHTQESAVVCRDWYSSVIAEQEESSSSVKKTRVLLFNCREDKDPARLLVPFIDLDFDHVIFVPSHETTSTLTAVEACAARDLVELPTEWQEKLRVTWDDISRSHLRTKSHVMPSPEHAARWLMELQKTQQVEVLVTGSLYIVGSMLGLLSYNIE